MSLYFELETAWAEYEYICQVIKSRIVKILGEDVEYFEKKGQDIHYDIDIVDKDIIITSNVGFRIRTVFKIDKILGAEGRILTTGKKKAQKVKLIYDMSHMEDIHTTQTTFDRL